MTKDRLQSQIQFLVKNLNQDELEIFLEYGLKLAMSRSKEGVVTDVNGTGYVDKSDWTLSEELQKELEPLPGVPRYTNIVVG
jgi:hypothetical protein